MRRCLPIGPHGVAMIAREEASQQPAKLEQVIRRRIVQRVGGRLQSLDVKVIDDRVVVSGRAASFHAKQLALQGILDVIGTASTMQIELNLNEGVSLAKWDAEQP